jgi:2-C-methyl-D-erythritol 4-phosphate cytidylyltransferase
VIDCVLVNTNKEECNLNIAIIIAGGVGSRMGKDIPKQFIEVKGKPVLAYTLEGFQKHPLIDAIEVVCIDGWEDDVWAYVEQYGITKLKWITKGGASGQESIRNGVYNLKDKCSSDDNIVIHDGIRPLVEDYVLEDIIEKCNEYGNGVTSMPYNEQIFLVDDDISTVKYIPRETLRRVATPQAYKYQLLDDKYHEAFEKEIGIYGSSYTNTMMVELGVRLYFANGSDRNLKLTTPGDLEIFEAMLEKGEVK